MESLGEIHATLKTGDERLVYKNEQLQFTLLDFWRWNSSDLVSNATRGRFAEYIVATATNIDISQVRDEWGNYDLETTDGIKIEVKSSAYFQTWAQKALSIISFGIKAAESWDLITLLRIEPPKRSADVYVFCLLHPQENKQNTNPLIMDQWEFYVLATEEVNNYKRSKSSITLNSLRGLTKAVEYDKLDLEIREKYKLNITRCSSVRKMVSESICT